MFQGKYRIEQKLAEPLWSALRMLKEGVAGQGAFFWTLGNLSSSTMLASSNLIDSLGR